MEDKNTLESRYFSWDGWDQHDTMCFSFYDVEFVVDFGVFKKGEKFRSVGMNYDSGLLEAYQDGPVVKSQKFGLEPVE